MRQEEQEPESLELIYELALSRLESQVRQIEGVDTKLNFVMSVAILVIGVGATLFVGRAQDIVSWTKILFAVSGVIYLSVVVVGVRAYAFLDLKYPPNVRQVWLDALYWPRQITKRQVLSQIVQALELNKEPISRKIKLATLALYLVAAEVIAVLLTVATLIF